VVPHRAWRCLQPRRVLLGGAQCRRLLGDSLRTAVYRGPLHSLAAAAGGYIAQRK
jgi:hypothetical protein